jgi:SAM-dependent methyltransferase
MDGTLHGTIHSPTQEAGTPEAGTHEAGLPAGSAAAFYATPRGTTAAAVLRDRMAAFWPDLTGMAVLGLGYAEPYLTLWRETAYRCVSASPASRAPVPGGHACLVQEDRLPFPDLSFDRILLIHGVDEAGDASRLLREVWRVLKDDGRILVVAPNRLGIWAHVETTPFGQGHPYSHQQIAALLAAGMFRAERRDAALFVPPVNMNFLLRGWPIWEQAGHALARDLAGVILMEAVKDAYAALPTASVVRRHVIMPDTVPADLAAAAGRAHPTRQRPER